MASTNKNLIQSLRSAHDPHFKLEGRVEGLEKNIPIQIAQLHKTLSKSFGMQRKTLMRVLGLEKKLAELEASKGAQQEAEQEVEDVIDDVQDAVDEAGESIDEEIPEQLDNVLDDIRGEEEIGGSDDVSEITPPTSTATKPKPKRKRLRIKKKKISGSDLKKDSSQESVEKIESRVSDNEKKITLIKSILKAQKSDLGENLRSLEPESESESEEKQISSPLLETLQAIAATTESIRDTLIQKQDNDKDIMEDIRVDQEKADADKQEKGLENNAKPKPLAKLGEKIAAPVVGLFGKIFNFIKTLFLGKFLMNFLDWFGNPENQGKIQSLIKFVGDYWPALTAAVLLFGTGFGGLVSGLLTSVAAFIPKMIAAVATMNPLLAIGLGTAAVVGGTALYMNNKKKNKEDENQQEEPQKFNKGGQVPGSGNTDTVPAMLTPGEFVMSKGAVQKYGANTMESMNAAAGGTNKPTYGDVPEMSMNQQIMKQIDYNEDGSISTYQATPEQRHASYKEMGIPSMELWDGSVVPDVGKMGAEKIPAALAQTREMLVNDGAPPENIAKLDELIASPDVQPAAIQNSINRIVPGSQEQVLGDLGDDISAKAKMSGGGIVQPMAGGGVVNAKDISAAGGGKVESNSGIKIKGMGADTQLLAAKPGESVLQPGVREKIFRDTGKDVLAYNKGPNANRPTVSNTNNITAASTGGIVNSRTPLLPKVTRMNVGGIVPAPYPEGDDILNAYPMMGYKGGGDVVDAKLTPGEIVMNEMQQRRMKKQSGFDPASFVPPAQPGKVKFASGGKVAKGMDIPTPNKKSGGVIVIGGGDQTPPPPQSSGGSGGGDTVPRIPSTDPHNIMTSVVKTIYNMVG